MPFKNPHPLYNVWMSMKGRCRNPRNIQYADYGGRGISVCDRWMASFAAFAEDMGPRPAGTSLDRIDNNGNYEPGNCRWATRREQQRNQRRAVFVQVDGVTYRAIELADLAGVKTDTIVERAARGLPYDQVVSRTALKPDYAKLIPIVVERAKATKAAKTHCKRGHEYTPENTRITPEGWKNCRQCHNEKMRARNAAKRNAV